MGNTWCTFIQVIFKSQKINFYIILLGRQPKLLQNMPVEKINVFLILSFRYNAISVGICFVGTFCTKLPPQIALEQAKALIRYGVEQGEIDKDYALIGNCQVSSSKSPGECLFEEIQTWDHYDPSITLENPSSLIEAA